MPVELVWIGSASTLQGLEQARPIWEAVAEAVPGLRLRVICDRFPDSFPLPIVPVAWNEETEAHEIAAGQIGISWIPDDLWSRGKCGLKVLQYQAAGLPVVANPVGAHRRWFATARRVFWPRPPSSGSSPLPDWSPMRGCGSEWGSERVGRSRRITRSQPGARRL